MPHRVLLGPSAREIPHAVHDENFLEMCTLNTIYDSFIHRDTVIGAPQLDYIHSIIDDV